MCVCVSVCVCVCEGGERESKKRERKRERSIADRDLIDLTGWGKREAEAINYGRLQL